MDPAGGLRQTAVGSTAPWPKFGGLLSWFKVWHNKGVHIYIYTHQIIRFLKYGNLMSGYILTAWRSRLLIAGFIIVFILHHPSVNYQAAR